MSKKSPDRTANSPVLLVLASTYPRWPADHEPGFVHELSRRLTDRFSVVVLGPHSAGAASEEVLDSVQVCRFRYAPEQLETLVNDGGIVTNLKRKPWKWLLVPFFILTQVLATRRAIRRWCPDVIHAHWLIPQGLIVALLSLVSGKTPPFLVTSHGADLHALRFWPMPALKRFVVRRATAVTVVSSAMLDAMNAQGIPTDGVRVEPMGVDLQQRFTPDKSVLRSKDEILFVGRLVEKKGLRYLLEAMPAIIKEHPDAHLTVAGFGPEEKALREQAKHLDIADKVRFLGAVPQHKLPGLYRRAAVFVAPFIEAVGGDQEGLGLVTVEAMGCGCPVVISDLPAVADVVSDKKRRVEPANPEKLGEAVVRVLWDMAGSDQQQIDKFRSEIFERMDWAGRAMKYRELLHSCVIRMGRG